MYCIDSLGNYLYETSRKILVWVESEITVLELSGQDLPDKKRIALCSVEVVEKEIGGMYMVKIIADSTCDLSKELIAKYDIAIIPLHILLGENEYEDGFGITPDEIFKWSDANGVTPKTSACALDTAMEVMRPFVEQKQDIICFTIASGMSTTINVMKLAAEELEAEDSIHVVDSENLSTGIGLQVLLAATLAQKGKNVNEILEIIEEKKSKVRSSFVVDTLTYLHRGGRCSGVAALAGGVLKLHPKIEVVNGKMDASKKYRGKINAVVMNYVKDMEADLKNADPSRVFITHSGCDEKVIASVREYLEELHVFEEILETRAGGVISSHCGPGTLGVLYIAG